MPATRRTTHRTRKATPATDTAIRQECAFWDTIFTTAVAGFSRRREYQHTFPTDLVEDAAAVATTALTTRARVQRELWDMRHTALATAHDSD